MNFITFEKHIDKLTKIIDRGNYLYHEFKIDINDYENEFFEAITLLQEELFTKEGSELITWWLYERDIENEEITSQNLFDPKSLESFYSYLLKQKYIK